MPVDHKNLVLFFLITIVGFWLSNSTRPVNAYTVVSNSAIDPVQQLAPQAWTWNDFGRAVFTGAVGGAAGGAVASAFGVPSVAAGAGVGAAAGAAAGAASYAVEAAWHALFGRVIVAPRTGVPLEKVLD